MAFLEGKQVVVVGATGSVGSEVVRAVGQQGARTLAVARNQQRLKALAECCTSVQTLALDATDEDSPRRVFNRMLPSVLVVASGADPVIKPIQHQSWDEFTTNWRVDVKITFQFCKEALLRPLSKGSTVVIISSGAAAGGSPITGGYAGSKRTEMFIANYCQKESDRLGLGVRFFALAPRMMPSTRFGGRAVDGYSGFQGVSREEYIRRLPAATKAADVADLLVGLVTDPTAHKAGSFIVSGAGLEAMG
jgi:NAD(P)-dependent dehydrogenase (short-subunit alcohol dehydrogenase family)